MTKILRGLFYLQFSLVYSNKRFIFVEKIEMMKQITVNIPENDYPTVLQFLGTLDAVEIVSDAVETPVMAKKSTLNEEKKHLKLGIDNAPFDRDELRKNHRLTWENISKLRELFEGAPFDEMEKLLIK